MDVLSPEFWPLVLVGFLAQLIDGAMGMAYGVSASAFLTTMGHPPAFVSATVHAAEVVTTGASGLSHAWFRNLDRSIFIKLVIPGMVGVRWGLICSVLLMATSCVPLCLPTFSSWACCCCVVRRVAVSRNLRVRRVMRSAERQVFSMPSAVVVGEW